MRKMKKTTKKLKFDARILIVLTIFSVIFVTIFVFAISKNNNSISGYEILGENSTDYPQNITTDSPVPTPSQPEILSEDQNLENITDDSNEIIENSGNESSNITADLENSTNISQILNETFEISNETLQNETSLEQNLTEIVNETQNITENTTINQNITQNETVIQNLTENTTEVQNVSRNILVEMTYPKKVTRGESVTIKSTVSNLDTQKVENLVIDWNIPSGFTLISGNQSYLCGTMEPNAVCASEISQR
jgi:hypothetical protein